MPAEQPPLGDWTDVVGSPRLTREEKGTKIFDVLAASVGLTIHDLVLETGLTRSEIAQGIRWLRDTLGNEALVCNHEIYSLALTPDEVTAYRAWTLQYIVTRLTRHQKVLEAGKAKFGTDPDALVGIEMIRTGVLMLERAMSGGRGTSPTSPTVERVH
jgi:hypothetical protein